MQRLLGEAVWDADAVRDDVRGYVIVALVGRLGGEPGDLAGVLILDDTADLKKVISPWEPSAIHLPRRNLSPLT